MKPTDEPVGAPLRILHLNSLPDRRRHRRSMRQAGGPTAPARPERLAGRPGWAALCARIVEARRAVFRHRAKAAASLASFFARPRFIRREKMQIVHGHHGRDIWPTIFAARLAGTKPKIVLTRHMAKSPGSWASRRFLLGQCDALIAVSEFVAKVLREGVYEPRIAGGWSAACARRCAATTPKSTSSTAALTRRNSTRRTRKQRGANWGCKPGDYAFAVVGGFDLPRGKGQREFLPRPRAFTRQAPHARFLIIGRGSMEEILQERHPAPGPDGKSVVDGAGCGHAASDERD